MRESRVAIRAEFDKNRLVADPVQIEGLLTMVDESEDMLLHGVVRGELNATSGNYGKWQPRRFRTIATKNLLG